MKTLILVRHAQASWDSSHQRDFDRPLDEQGLRDASSMAKRLSTALTQAPRILASPALRARQTAEIFARVLGVTSLDFRQEIYEATSGTLLAVINRLNDKDPHVLVVGHNPGMSELGRLLAQSAQQDMSTCAVASYWMKCNRWADATPGCAQLIKLDTPSNTGSIF